MIQANGGNDTLDITGSITSSTVYGGQGTDYISGVDAASTISSALISGNLGADKLIFNTTNSVFNTEIYGSDSAGTDTGADSIVIAAQTVQTSTVYGGGAGADTLILSGNLASGQFIEGDFNAFAGNDSVNVTGSFVSTTVQGGAGNDTIFISGRTASGEGSSATAFYGGDGTDSLQVSGRGTSVYGGGSADSTTDGADTISITNLYSATVYGAAGADSIILSNTIDSVRVEAGTGANFINGSGTLSDTTILGGAAADSLALTGTVDGYFDGAAGADTLVFAAVTGTSGSESTVLGGEGATPSVQLLYSPTPPWRAVLVSTAFMRLVLLAQRCWVVMVLTLSNSPVVLLPPKSRVKLVMTP